MLKQTLFGFVAAAVVGTSAFAAPTAIQVDIFGMGPAVDAVAYRRVRQVIGSHVTSGTIDKFQVLGYGIEGGFSACIEPSRFAKAGSVDTLLFQLRSIRPNPHTTSYVVKSVESCR